MAVISRILGPFFLVYWLAVFLPITLLFAICVLILSIFFPAKYGYKLRVFAEVWGWLGIRLAFSRVKVLHAEKAIRKPCVIISNHQSPFDIFAAAGFYPVDFVFLSKKEVFKVPLVGMAMRKIGYLEVDRKNPRAAANSMKNVIRKLKENERVLIYPEGTRSKDASKILPFKSGAFMAAKQGELPILPIVLYGTQEIRPMTRPWHLWPHRVVIEVLDPIYIDNTLHPANQNSKLSDQQKSEQMRLMVQDAYLKLKSEYGK